MTVKYKVHPQVVLEKVGGRYLLIAFGKGKEVLPYIREINETGAFYWEQLSYGYDTDDMILRAMQVYELQAQVLERGLQAFLNELEHQGYLLADASTPDR